MVGARATLKEALAADHESVDAAFGGFDLADKESYAAFLSAHARALFAVEAALAEQDVWPDWRPRSDLIRDDLAALDRAAPSAFSDPLPSGDAAAWGMLYVLEGSRLGGRMLSGQVSPSLPGAYLGACHLPGEWKRFIADLGEHFGRSSIKQLEEAEQAARLVFALFARAAAEEAGTLGV